MADRAFGNKKDIGEIRQGPVVKFKKREFVEDPKIIQDVNVIFFGPCFAFDIDTIFFKNCFQQIKVVNSSVKKLIP